MMALGSLFGQRQGSAPAQQSARCLKSLGQQDKPTTTQHQTSYF